MDTVWMKDKLFTKPFSILLTEIWFNWISFTSKTKNLNSFAFTTLLFLIDSYMIYENGTFSVVDNLKNSYSIESGLFGWIVVTMKFDRK